MPAARSTAARACACARAAGAGRRVHVHAHLRLVEARRLGTRLHLAEQVAHLVREDDVGLLPEGEALLGDPEGRLLQPLGGHDVLNNRK